MTLQATGFRIQTVNSRADSELFLDVPEHIYANDPYWVQPLRVDVAAKFNQSNPFFHDGKIQRFVAVASSSGQAVGRVAALIDPQRDKDQTEKIGYFGFFECVADQTVSRALLSAACEWLHEQGVVVARGPVDLAGTGTRNTFILIDGFDASPMVMMPYNRSYYSQLLENNGWVKARDAFAYNLPLDRPLPHVFEKLYNVACDAGITFRPVETIGEGFERDCERIFHLMFEDAGFVGFDRDEFEAQARMLQRFIDPAICVLAEHEDKAVGLFLGLPDYNMAFKHVRGRLNWLGKLKFLWFSRHIDQGRVVAICALPEYRRKMVPTALVYAGMQGGIQKARPYKQAELSWVYEDHLVSNKLCQASGAIIYKTYRLYEKQL